jgi:hypothetical protein
MQTKTLSLLLLGILTAGLAACRFPTADTPTPFFAPTPNLTMTALFSPDNIASPTPAILATATTQAEPTATPLPLPTNTPLPLPTNTSLPPTATPIPERVKSYFAPYLNDAPSLDGVWDEWTTTKHPAQFIVYGREKWTGESDLEGSYRIGWDEDYLYLAVKVIDDTYAQDATGEDIFKGDSIELLLDTNLNGDFFVQQLSADDFQIGISPGRNEAGEDTEAYLWYPRADTGKLDDVKIGALYSNGIYRIEAAIPWSVFDINPVSGRQFGFAISISDNDDTSENVQQSMASNVQGRVLTDPTTWAELVLTK